MSIKLGTKPADVGLWQDIGTVGHIYSGPDLQQKWAKKLTKPDLTAVRLWL